MIPIDSGRDDITTWPGEHYKKTRMAARYIGRVQPPAGDETYINRWEYLNKEQRKRFARVIQTCTIKACADDFDLANIFDSVIGIGMEE